MKRQNSDKGVSPIIGVILMVALAVILAAVISQFTLEMQGLLQEPIQAGITVSEDYNADTDTYDVTITYSSEGTVDRLHVVEPDGSHTPHISNVGETINVTGADEGQELQIIGTLDTGEQGVIQSYEVG